MKTKKTKTKITAVIMAAILMPVFSFAQWDDCVHGEENCEYPGDCGSYVDTNRDQICDHSQPEPVAQPALIEKTTQKTVEDQEKQEHDLVSGQEVKTMTVGEVAEVYGIDEDQYVAALSDEYGKKIKSTDEFQLLHDNFGVRPSDAKDVAESLVAGAKDTKETVSNTKEETTKAQNKSKRKYNFASTTIVLLVVYFATWLLAKKEKMKQLTHGRIWNVLLLITFILSGISGILLVIRINYGVSFVFPFNLLKIHVETGIAMAIITIFHIAWHWKYFKVMLKKN